MAIRFPGCGVSIRRSELNSYRTSVVGGAPALVLAWLAIALTIGIVLYNINLKSYILLSRHGLRAAGAVTAREPQDHDSVTASYSVGGRIYAVRRSFVAEPNPDKSTLRVGDAVTIFYLPLDPEVATIGDPSALIPNETISILMAMLGVPTFIVFVVRRRAERREAKRAP